MLKDRLRIRISVSYDEEQVPQVDPSQEVHAHTKTSCGLWAATREDTIFLVADGDYGYASLALVLAAGQRSSRTPYR